MKMRDSSSLISTFLVVTLLGVGAALAASSGSAQTTSSGSIEGTLTDINGAPVPGVTVTATRQGGRSVSATTNDEGFFRIPNLEPGRYTVTVEAGKGFARFEQADVQVNLTRATNVGVTLRPAGAAETVEVTSSSGPAVEVSQLTTDSLKIVTFDLHSGSIKALLAPDIRSGETFSGTAVAEPKGKTKEEQATNQAELKKYGIQIIGRPEFKPIYVPLGDVPAIFKYTIANDLPPGNALTVGLQLNLGPILAKADVAWTKPGAVITPDPKTTPAFSIPALGQQGRPVEIFGPFDGDATNTTLNLRPPNSTADFEKAPENVSGGFGSIRPLVESPRKIVFEVPANLIGPIDLNVKDGNNQATGTYRNVGVRLSAPKTNLLKGESTTLTIEVSGLQGITKDVPLTLTSSGVITMEGGPFQPLMIQPSQVNASGLYTTTRKVTGIMAGGWGATATVVTDRFNARLQDDNNPTRVFLWNTFNGDYIFRDIGTGGSSKPSGGTVQPGGTTQPGGPTGTPPITPPTGVNLTGTGRPQMKGCIITLSHNAPDRRVFARLDACTNTGNAEVQTNSPKADIKITDKNTADNTAASPPPK